MSQIPVVRNWRDEEPTVGHDNAIIWTLFRSRPEDQSDDSETNCLRRIAGFVKHAVQGRKNTNYHHHDKIEQVYCILKGTSEVLMGDKKHPVQAGDAVYLPPVLPHQNFNDGTDDWVELLILSCPVESFEGEPAIRSWRDARPASDEGGILHWPLFQEIEEGGPEGGKRLLGLSEVSLVGVQAGLDWEAGPESDHEQILYTTSGQGTASFGGDDRSVLEGTAIYVPPGSECCLTNDGKSDWLKVLRMSAPV